LNYWATKRQTVDVELLSGVGIAAVVRLLRVANLPKVEPPSRVGTVATTRLFIAANLLKVELLRNRRCRQVSQHCNFADSCAVEVVGTVAVFGMSKSSSSAKLCMLGFSVVTVYFQCV
jgi:hypothetical protein